MREKERKRERERRGEGKLQDRMQALVRVKDIYIYIPTTSLLPVVRRRGRGTLVVDGRTKSTSLSFLPNPTFPPNNPSLPFLLSWSVLPFSSFAMSGSNPFRPKNPQNAFAPPNHPSLPSYPSTSSNPPAVTFPSMSFRPVPQTPPASLTPDLDDTASSDDQSVSDPFHQHSYATDEDAEEDEQQDVDDLNPKRTYQIAQPPPGADDRSLPSIRTVPDPALSSRGSAPPAAVTAPVQRSIHNHPVDLEQVRPSRENAPIAGSTVSTRSSTSHGGTRTPDSSSTDVSRPSDLRPGPASRAGSGLPLSSEIGSRPLASRPSNRDRIPPPPPKSHHGKRIAPSPGTTPALTQTTPGKSTSRFSFHGSPSEPSYPRRPSQSGSDYFSAQPRDEPAPPQPAESL
ncbi:hypothetical protein ASPCADRAFT_127177, partial [Aspergillus carbonarius ITEM 5010]